ERSMLWREDGLERVFVGLEFFRDEDLKYVRKNSTSSDNEAAVRILHGLNIECTPLSLYDLSSKRRTLPHSGNIASGWG
ncbi:MAG: hypothetical protein MUP03_09010, partial [Anaerolineales bacterium]|nr:hypothetical protein [Anaerolineales bacterium]